MDNQVAAAQLATLLLLVVVVLLHFEKLAQARLRFSSTLNSHTHSPESRLQVLSAHHGWLVCIACGGLVFLGFALPIFLMFKPLIFSEDLIPWNRFIDWSLNSLRLGLITALLAVGLSLLIAFGLRAKATPYNRLMSQMVGLGYAIPGAVVVVGMLIPVMWLQRNWPASTAGYWITASVLGLIWAYLVRFCAVALQSVQSGYARLPSSLDDSAATLGVSGFRLLRIVHIPLLTRSISAAALLVFVDVMKELPATLVLRPFNTDTLAVVAYQLARDERLGEAALPSLALVCVGLIPVLMLSRGLRHKT
jgi:iron(III) transport system permease protein